MHSTVSSFLEKYGRDPREVPIFDDGGVIRYSAAFLGEKPTRRESFSLRNLLRSISVNRERAFFLLLICTRLKPKRILEIGSAYGVSALYIIAGMQSDERYLTCIEVSNYYFGYLTKMLEPFQDECELIRGDALVKTGEEKFLKGPKFDLVFVDGSHQKEFNIGLFAHLVQIVSVGGIIIFDDIHWSQEMSEMWRQVSAHHRVFHSVDFGSFGVIILK